jgi:hypothetical protein
MNELATYSSIREETLKIFQILSGANKEQFNPGNIWFMMHTLRIDHDAMSELRTLCIESITSILLHRIKTKNQRYKESYLNSLFVIARKFDEYLYN